MLFYSELIGKNVYSESQHLLGILRDFIFLYEDNPRVTKIVCEKQGLRHVIPILSLKQISSGISVRRDPKNHGPLNHELMAANVLLDKQIIDLGGNKVVRVNDIVFQDTSAFSISGIDIGILGLLRRLNVEWVAQKIARVFHITIPMQLVSWGDILSLELDYGQIKLKQQEERLANIHEEDLADYLEMTNIKNVDTFLKTLSTKRATAVLESLTINYQVELMQNFDPRKSSEIITLMDPDEAVDVLLALERSKRDKIMKLLAPDKQSDLHRLMTFSRTPVGKLMTSEFFAVGPQMLARDIIKTLKSDVTEFSSLPTIYVLNRDDQLVGVFTPHELLLQDLDTPAYKFMVPEPIVVLLTTPIEVVVYKLLKYKISALPVINREKKILGIVTIDDVSDILLKKIQ